MSKFKVKITRPGVNTNEGELAIGQVIEVDGVGENGTDIPGFLINKCVVIGDNEGRDLTADNADIEALKKQVADLTAERDALKARVTEFEELELLQLQEDYKTVIGTDPDKRWGAKKLREEIAKAAKV